MRFVLGLALAVCACAQPPYSQPPNTNTPRPIPKVAGDPMWRRNLLGVIGQRPANATARDVERMEQYMLSAAPYCATLTPGDYEANRELVRQMTAYLMTVNTVATDPQVRASALRVSRAAAVFPCAFPAAATPKPQAPQAAAPKPPDEPPFALKAPEIENVADAEKETAADLRQRYETDAAKSAVVWRNAQTLRESLAARGMSLNADTAASVNRLQLFFEEAATALQGRKWDDALSSLQAAEAETQKAAKTVGQ